MGQHIFSFKKESDVFQLIILHLEKVTPEANVDGKCKIHPLISKTVLLWLLVGVKEVWTLYWKIKILAASFLFLMALYCSSGQSVSEG